MSDRFTAQELSMLANPAYIGAHQPWVGELDLVNVVRCRDCRRFELDNSDHDYRSGWWCHRWNTDMVRPDGFCAWAEVRM